VNRCHAFSIYLVNTSTKMEDVIFNLGGSSESAASKGHWQTSEKHSKVFFDLKTSWRQKILQSFSVSFIQWQTSSCCYERWIQSSPSSFTSGGLGHIRSHPPASEASRRVHQVFKFDFHSFVFYSRLAKSVDGWSDSRKSVEREQ